MCLLQMIKLKFVVIISNQRHVRLTKVIVLPTERRKNDNCLPGDLFRKPYNLGLSKAKVNLYLDVKLVPLRSSYFKLLFCPLASYKNNKKVASPPLLPGLFVLRVHI